MPTRQRVEALASAALVGLEALADSAVSATRGSAPAPRRPGRPTTRLARSPRCSPIASRSRSCSSPSRLSSWRPPRPGCGRGAHPKRTRPKRCSRRDLVAAPATHAAAAVAVLLRAGSLELRRALHQRPMPDLWLGAGRRADGTRVVDGRPAAGLAGFRAPRPGDPVAAGRAHSGPGRGLHSACGPESSAEQHRVRCANGFVLALSVGGTRDNLIPD